MEIEDIQRELKAIQDRFAADPRDEARNVETFATIAHCLAVLAQKVITLEEKMKDIEDAGSRAGP